MSDDIARGDSWLGDLPTPPYGNGDVVVFRCEMCLCVIEMRIKELLA